MSCLSNDNIPLYTESSPDWTKTGNAPPPYAVGIEVGMNEYTFGRTTPDNKFVVASGLERNPHGIEMIGGKKSKSKSKKLSSVKKLVSSKSKKSSDKKSVVSKSKSKTMKTTDKKSLVSKSKPKTKKTTDKKSLVSKSKKTTDKKSLVSKSKKTSDKK